MTELTGISSPLRYLDELDVGDQWQSRGRTITEADLLTFGTWSGDMHPLHTDEEYARKTQFGTRIFHGPGALAIAFGLEMSLGWKLGSAIAFLGLKDWNLRAPVFIGDTLHVDEQVADIRPSASKADRGVVTTRVQLINQAGTVCQDGLWTVLMYRQAPPVLPSEVGESHGHRHSDNHTPTPSPSPSPRN
jgi:acyl dehydratase